jgi:hypothetical protein
MAVRRKTGGGKHRPFPHIVRIVVVRPKSMAQSPTGQSQDLTKRELKEAENILKKMAAPPSNPPSMEPTTNMFETLKPTDIVVVGLKPASVLTVDSSGKPVTSPPPTSHSSEKLTKKLFAHDDGNKDTVLRVWTESDTIEYRCDEEFEIVRVEKAGWKIHGTPNNPFGGRRPYRAKRSVSGGESLWVWKSGVLAAKANNQQYKPMFKIGGEEIDPDVVCGSPPPSP